jgi:hypothetical protein
MKYTIVADLHSQVIHCCVCEVDRPIPRSLLRNEAGALVEFVDQVQLDHRECVEHVGNPDLARLSREFRKRLEREQQRAAQRRAA